MEEIAELARRIDRDKIARAREMDVAEKFAAGAELFEQACEMALCGIRALHPEWTDCEVADELRRRIELGTERQAIGT